MPLYAYQCKDCGVRFERRQGFDDPAVTVCPECEGSVHRLIQPAGVIFKGSGFYVTDHKSSSRNAASSKSDKSDKPTTDKSSGEKAKASESKSGESKSEKSTASAKSDA
jgi:putative FmdB family regulatory protein